MLLPLLASVLASLKSTTEAAAVPPTYFPHGLSLDSYMRLWEFQAGVLTYLGNSAGAAALTILFCLALTIPAGYALARFPIPFKEVLFVALLLGLIIPYQALLTPLFFMFVQLKLHNSLVGLAIIHTAIQLPFSVYLMRNAFEAVPRELEEAAVIDGCNSFQVLTRVCLPAIIPAVITVSLFAFITSWNEFLAALVVMNKDSGLHPAPHPRRGAAADQHRRNRLGHAAGRRHHLDHSLHGVLPVAAEILRLRLPQRRDQVAWTTPIHHPPRPTSPRRPCAARRPSAMSPGWPASRSARSPRR